MGGLRDNDQLDLMGRLVSPHGWDGMGSVPSLVHEAGGDVARLRVKFVNQWMPGADSPLTTREVNELFDAAAITAEWLREVTEARDHAVAEAERLRLASQRLLDAWPAPDLEEKTEMWDEFFVAMRALRSAVRPQEESDE